jgi:hypothetical protein
MSSHKISARCTLEIDTKDAETPAMVIVKQGRETFTATYDCAMQTGLVSNEYDIELTPAELDKLEPYQDQVDAAYATARDGNPSYK